MTEGEQTLIESLDRRGDLIGDRYLVADLVGVGGMGVVYAAVHRALDRTVAIKVPRPELARDPFARRRFRAEALAGSRVEHPNVVRVLDSGEHDGSPYVVMEHVAGSPLGKLVSERGPLTVEVALDLAGQLLAGIEAVHEAGVIHGDIKCDNVLVETRRDGSAAVKLIDFGLARLFGPDLYVNESVVAGTPEYLAPEVLEGEPISAASDQYSAGVVLYELLTGVAPFRGATTAEIVARQHEGDAVPLAVHRRELARWPDLDAIVGRALARRPHDRFADIAELATALREAVPEVSAPRLGLHVTSEAWFSTSAPTRAWRRDETSAARLAVGSAAHEGGVIAGRRRAAYSALVGGDSEAIVSAYLDLARVLVDDHQLAAAATELGAAAEVLALRGDDKHVWRVQLTLAAIYGGLGETPRALRIARAAQLHASRAGAVVGVARAQQLFMRLARARA